MWCDNCLLVFPLRGGAIILATAIAIHNLIGGIILFKYGEFLSAVLLESQIEGGIAMASMSICIILIIGLANSNCKLFSNFKIESSS